MLCDMGSSSKSVKDKTDIALKSDTCVTLFAFVLYEYPVKSSGLEINRNQRISQLKKSVNIAIGLGAGLDGLDGS